MCGLVGVAGKLNVRDENTMRRLLMLDYFRGPDSTGIAAIRETGDPVIVKMASDPIMLFENYKFKIALDGTKSKAFIGHNRSATRGAVSNFNAHPFQYEHVIGTHNGTLDLDSWKRLEKAVGETFAVDSQALIAAIAKLGIKEAISLCATGENSTEGAWSLVWYDLDNGTLNFLRNKHRPMWLAYEKNFDRMFWASQWPMIDAAINLSEMGPYEMYSEGKEDYKYFATEEDRHYKFDLAAMKASGKKPKPTIATVKGKEPVKVASSGPNTNPFGRITSGNGMTPSEIVTKALQERAGSSTTSTKANLGGTNRPSNQNVLNWMGSDKFPYAGIIDKPKFERIAAFGCSWCTESLFWGDPCVVYERDEVVLCPQCSAISNDNDGVKIFVPNGEFERLK